MDCLHSINISGWNNILSKYGDQDDDEPEDEYTINDLSYEKALKLGLTLGEGKVDDLEKAFSKNA